MQKDNSIYRLKRAKLIQLTLTIGIDLVFFIIFMQRSFQAALSDSPAPCLLLRCCMGISSQLSHFPSMGSDFAPLSFSRIKGTEPARLSGRPDQHP